MRETWQVCLVHVTFNSILYRIFWLLLGMFVKEPPAADHIIKHRCIVLPWAWDSLMVRRRVCGHGQYSLQGQKSYDADEQSKMTQLFVISQYQCHLPHPYFPGSRYPVPAMATPEWTDKQTLLLIQCVSKK